MREGGRRGDREEMGEGWEGVKRIEGMGGGWLPSSHGVAASEIKNWDPTSKLVPIHLCIIYHIMNQN